MMYQLWLHFEPVQATAQGPRPAFEGQGNRVDTRAMTVVTHSHDRVHYPSGPIFPWRDLDEPASVSAMARDVWETADEVMPLLQHAAREGAASDVFLGGAPETWSPLGAVRPESAGAWRASHELFSGIAYDQVGIQDPPRHAIAEVGPDATSMVLRTSEGDLPADVLCVSFDAVIVVVPSGTTLVEAQLVPTPVGRSEPRPDMPSLAALDAAYPQHAGQWRQLIQWRVYTGANSLVEDTVTTSSGASHFLRTDALRGAGVAVGRAIWVASRRTDRKVDPFAATRRLRAEAERPTVARRCPDLREESRSPRRAVVVVHGTMSTGMALAAALLTWAPDAAIFRYEHDTWLPVETNAQQLADLVERRVGDEVLLVAHSRGGLVAVRAEQILRDRRTMTVRQVITMGTPFLGTPVAHASDVAWASMHVVLGGLRFAGGPVVDCLTRIGAYAIRRDPPPGITEMHPTSSFLPLLARDLPSCLCPLAGMVADADARDYHGPAAFRAGIGRGVFGEEPNDMVVATESARSGMAGAGVVDSDHYSYLQTQTVQAAVTEALASFDARRPFDEVLVW